MEKFLVENPVLKRILLTLIGTVVIAAGKKLGLDLDDVQVGAIAAVIIAAITGSNWKEAALEKARLAAAPITDKAAAIEELKK